MSELSAVEVGMQLPPVDAYLTRTTLVRYAGASGDFNPIHHSDLFAAQLGLPSVIAHGMLTMGTALRIVTDWAGDPSRVKSYFVRFTKPVTVPDDGVGALVKFTGKVTKVEDGVATIGIEALYGDVKVLGLAVAEVRLD